MGGGNEVLGRHILGEVDKSVRRGSEKGWMVLPRKGWRGKNVTTGSPASGGCANRFGVGDDLFDAPVAGETTGHEHVRSRAAAREEAGGSGVVDGPVTGHVEQRRRGRPAGGRHE